jgi:hypothetical protein
MMAVKVTAESPNKWVFKKKRKPKQVVQSDVTAQHAHSQAAKMGRTRSKSAQVQLPTTYHVIHP